MRWLVTGGSGLLGSAVLDLLGREWPSHVVFAPTSRDMDLRDQAQLARVVRSLGPDILVNCAAWTDVDRAEVSGSEVRLVNGEAPRTMAKALNSLGKGVLVQISTDYVFSGESKRPYAEDDPTASLSIYGLSKIEGESCLDLLPSRAIIARTSWLYDVVGRSFVARTLGDWRSGREVRAVADQTGHPTWVFDAARRIVLLAHGLSEARIPAGRYHAVNSDTTTWLGLARETIRLAGGHPEDVAAIEGSALARIARRPRRVVLTDERAVQVGLPPMRSWRSALADAVSQAH